MLISHLLKFEGKCNGCVKVRWKLRVCRKECVVWGLIEGEGGSVQPEGKEWRGVNLGITLEDRREREKEKKIDNKFSHEEKAFTGRRRSKFFTLINNIQSLC